MFEASKLDLETQSFLWNMAVNWEFDQTIQYQSHFFDEEDWGSTVCSAKNNNKISKDKNLNHGVYQQIISTIF